MSITLIVSIICAAVITKLVIACGGNMYDPANDASFFLPAINDHKDYKTFHYTSYSSFFSDDDESGDQNTKAWSAYTYNEANEGDIAGFVYLFAAKDVAKLYRYLKNGDQLSVSDTFRDNSFTKWLISHKEINTVQYLLFAKTCEPYSVGAEAVWNDKKYQYEPGKVDSVDMQKLIAEGTAQYNKTKNDELKLRYAYQVLRMSFYSRNYRQTISLFEKFIHPKKKNFLYYRCLSLNAGALYKMHRKNEAAYLYSVVFDHSQEKRKMLNTSFNWSAPNDVDSVLAFCKNDHERAVACIMYGLYGSGEVNSAMIDLLKDAYAFDPGVKALEILMTQAINSMEREMISNLATTKGDDPLLDSISSFCIQVATEGKNPHVAYWYISAAYADILNGNAEKCKKYLDKASGRKMTDQEREVHELVNVLYVVRKYGNITEATEAELLPLLKKLEDAAGGKYEGSGYGNIFYNMMITVLEKHYEKQGNPIRGIYCNSKQAFGLRGFSSRSDFADAFSAPPGSELNGISIEQLHAVQAFIAKKNKTPFEKWLTANTPYTLAALRELEGTKYIQDHNFDSAIAVLKKVPDSVLDVMTLPDVLVSHIRDNQETDESDNNVSYNKLSFAKKMVELERKLKKDPKDSRAAYQYANALYNISYYGKAHRAYDYYRNSADHEAYFTGDRKSDNDYYSVELSEKYYLQAFENSTDKEMKARCLFMAAKCWQKNCPGIFNPWNEEQKDYYNSTFKNPYLTRLKNEYQKTKFFADARGTCSYFRDYVKKK